MPDAYGSARTCFRDVHLRGLVVSILILSWLIAGLLRRVEALESKTVTND